MSASRRTPLHALHLELGARMMPFAGFDMPVQYTSILEEHRRVRTAAGLFDVSHMGQLHVSGAGATATLERLLSCRVSSLPVGAVRYGLLCNEAGGVVDDVTLYRLADEAYFLCVNAANIEKDWDWVRAASGPDVELENRSDSLGMLALQGPASPEVLKALGWMAEGDGLLDGLARFRFREIPGAGADAPLIVSNTGYTGAPGYEIYVAAEACEALARRLLDCGRDAGLGPIGLGARDTLRLEAALPLYGHELDDATSPIAAGLDRFVKLDAGGFIGCEAIRKRREDGEPLVLVGFELSERGIARADCAVVDGDREIGRVTSGAPSPTRGTSIGLAYVPPDRAATGSALSIRIRSKDVAARVVDTPFV